ncbi:MULTISPECIES: SDR family oxidoreductase [unclassified Leeuwenhoekiella]|uniref:SDR family oxidoreductase n=1 Tax=unclassified Leeuwenhoekiella TaxID=2615029 RepID=UPI000C56E15D|nr:MULTISPECIES: SDR family oxidoreductase [unclassified Leeuwenhoekiella]MBA82489.1 short-chain dehydrogenase [Leeuwenhoekiella sp.]|tara:strand:- start:1488 stop:2273 length:786 start_codon:yes stop_codon:yes gene_type:complete
MNINLSGKKALVGGSTSGIGRAIAMQLADSGATVTLMSRSLEKLEAVKAELATEHSQKHQVLQVDFTDFEAYKTIISGYFEDNSVDILVNNTQGPPAGTALEKDVDDYQQAFDLLFKSVVLTTELALKQMRKQQWGRVINVASVSIKEPLSYLVLSNSIRAAVVTWAKSLATEVGPDQVTVNSILTGYFDTERIASLNAKKAKEQGVSEKEVLEQMEAKVPVRRIGNPEEYGFLVAFLASNRAAYLTGTQIPIDGGLLNSL